MPYSCRSRGWRQFHFWSASKEDRGASCMCCGKVLSRSGSMTEQIRAAFDHLTVCDHDDHWIPDE
jgi:hypothetical protein